MGTLASKPLDDPDAGECPRLEVGALFNSFADIASVFTVVDCRSPDVYRAGHIDGAIPLACLADRAPRGSREYGQVVFYGHGGRGAASAESERLTGSRLRTWFKRPVFALDGGYEAFVAAYPWLCSNHRFYRPGRLPPTRVCEHVYVSNFEVSQQKAIYMVRLGLTHVLNCTESYPKPAFRHDLGLKCLRLPMSDRLSARISPHVRKGVAFITKAVASGGRVLVHCQQGINRSVAVVVAWMVMMSLLPPEELPFKRDFYTPTVDEAVAWVRGRRQRAAAFWTPDCGVLQQLRAFEEDVRQALGDSGSVYAPPQTQLESDLQEAINWKVGGGAPVRSPAKALGKGTRIARTE